jgi:hypothetical protein
MTDWHDTWAQNKARSEMRRGPVVPEPIRELIWLYQDSAATMGLRGLPCPPVEHVDGTCTYEGPGAPQIAAATAQRAIRSALLSLPGWARTVLGCCYSEPTGQRAAEACRKLEGEYGIASGAAAAWARANRAKLDAVSGSELLACVRQAHMLYKAAREQGRAEHRADLERAHSRQAAVRAAMLAHSGHEVRRSAEVDEVASVVAAWMRQHKVRAAA